jgi:rare lipoprotein A
MHAASAVLVLALAACAAPATPPEVSQAAAPVAENRVAAATPQSAHQPAVSPAPPARAAVLADAMVIIGPLDGDTQAVAESVDNGVRPEPSRQPIARGMASWYGPRFHGRRTASGERYDMHALTAAHKTLPFGTRVRVRSVHTGEEVVVRINDRGPYKHSRIIDLSLGAISALGLRHRGVTEVVLLRE